MAHISIKSFVHWTATFLAATLIPFAAQAIYQVYCKWKIEKEWEEIPNYASSSTSASLDAPENLESDDLEKRKPAKVWNRPIFFPPVTKGVMPRAEFHLSNLPESVPPIASIIHFFTSAKKSIQICALLLSEFELATVIRQQRNRGIMVQIITDHDTISEANGSMNSSSRFLSKIGIPVRTKNTDHLMHNKFVIFDEEAVLTGSLNFTKMAIRARTFENMLISTDPRIVKKYVAEFGLLWEDSTAWKYPTFKVI